MTLPVRELPGGFVEVHGPEGWRQAVLLERFAYTPVGTFGRLSLPEFLSYTVERAWKGNEPRVSCIPEGVYPVVRSTFFRRGYETLEVGNVPGRSLIKFHKGNVDQDLLGCIAPGRTLGCSGGRWAVAESALAFEDFMRSVNERNPRYLVVRSRVGEGRLPVPEVAAPA